MNKIFAFIFVVSASINHAFAQCSPSSTSFPDVCVGDSRSYFLSSPSGCSISSVSGNVTWTPGTSQITWNAAQNATINFQCSCGTVAATVKVLAPSAVGGTTVLSPSTACPGSSNVSISVTGQIGTITSWERKLTGSSTWETFSGATPPAGYINTTIEGDYRALITGTCGATAYSAIAHLTLTSFQSGLFLQGGGSSFCYGTAGVTLYLDNSSSAEKYQLKKPDGSLDPNQYQGGAGRISWIGLTAPGHYSMVAIKGSCSAPTGSGADVSFIATPAKYNLSASSTNYCSGTANPTLTLSGSEGSDVTYVLYKDNVAVTGQSRNGVNGALTFTGSGGGVYSVLAHRGSCSNIAMNNTVMVTQYTTPTVSLTPSAVTIRCGDKLNSAFSSDVTGSTLSWTSSLGNGSTVSGNTASGTTSPILDQLTGSGQVIYTIKATGPSPAFCQSAPKTLTVTVNALQQYYVYGTATICYDANTSVTLSSSSFSNTPASESGISYSLYKDGVLDAGQGSQTGGTGAVTWSVPGSTSGAAYTVKGKNGNCVTSMLSTATVTVRAVPIAYAVSTPQSFYCTGSNPTIKLANSEGSDVNYSIYKNGVYANQSIPGNNGQLIFTPTGSSNGGAAETYTILASRAGCANKSMSNSVSITPYKTPSVTSVTSLMQRCGDQVNYSITSDVANTTYTWSSSPEANSTVNGNTATGVTSTITDVLKGNGKVDYFIIPKGPSPAFCTGASKTLVVTVNPLNNYYLFGSGQVCYDAFGTLTLTTGSNFSNTPGSESNTNYTLYKDGVNAGQPVMTGGPATVSWSVSTAGHYTVKASNNTCIQDMPAAADITVPVKPAKFDVSALANYYCTGFGPTIKLSGSEGSDVQYTVYKNGSAVGTSLNGNNAQLTFSPPGSGQGGLNETYSVKASRSGCPGITMNNMPVINTYQTPALTLPQQVLNQKCGDQLSFSFSSDVANSIFTWNSSVTSGVISGNTSTQSNTGAITDILNGNGQVNYSIVAFGPTPASCQSAAKILTVNVATLNYYSLFKDGDICSAAFSTLTLSSSSFVNTPASQSTVTYTLYKDGVIDQSQSPQTGGPGAVQWFVTTGGNYIVKAGNGNCNADMGSATVSPLSVHIATDKARLCEGEVATIMTTGSAAGITYDLVQTVNGASSVVQSLAGTNQDLTFSGINQTGTYKVNTRTNGCAYGSSSNQILITVDQVNNFQLYSTGDLCNTAYTTLTLSTDAYSNSPGSDPNVIYTLFKDGQLDTSQFPQSGGNNAVVWIVTSGGNYSVKGVNGVCSKMLSGAATIAPRAFTIVADKAHICSGQASTITTSGSENSNFIYELINTENGSTVQSKPGTGSPLSFSNIATSGTYDVKVKGIGCSVNLTSNNVTITVDPFSPASVTLEPAAPTVCGEGKVTLNVSGQNINTVIWYDGNSHQPLSYSPTYITPELIANHTFEFKAINDAGCTTSGAASVQVFPIETRLPNLPYLTVVNNQYQLNINNANLSDLTPYWELTSGATATVTFPDPRPAIPGELYFVRGQNNHGCWGPAVQIRVPDLKPDDYETSPDPENVNFVRVFSYQKKNVVGDPETMASSDVTVSTNYIDGIGRVFQSVSKQASPGGFDLVQPTLYDAFGRESLKFLPYGSSASDGKVKTTPFSAQRNFYTSASKVAVSDFPVSAFLFDGSPLNGVTESAAEGESWSALLGTPSSNSVKTSLSTNAASDIYLFSVDVASGLVAVSADPLQVYYPENALAKNSVVDENKNEVVEYTDKLGKTICKRVQYAKDGNGNRLYASTYYVYDSFGNLSIVLPPEAMKNIQVYFNATATDKDVFLSNWAFRYKYDQRQRMVQKQVPGAKPVYMVYDDRDRLVLTQDGNQRAASPAQWVFTKYDEFNRPILTGIKDTTAILSQTEMQNVVNAFYLQKVWSRFGEQYVGNVTANVHGYSNRSYPVVQSGATVKPAAFLTVTYYDDYQFKNGYPSDYNYFNEGLAQTVNGVNYSQSSTEFTSVSGQITGTKTKILDAGVGSDASYLTTIMYYDDRYRNIQVVADNYRGGIDRTSTLVDFTGKILKSRTTHYGLTFTDLVHASNYANKLVKTISGAGWNTGGAASVEMIPANQDGWVEFTASTNGGGLMVGFSPTNQDANWTSIRHALYLMATGVLDVRENGSSTNFLPSHPPYAAGDVFRIERKQGKINYYQNGNLLLQRTAVSNALLIDVAFNGGLLQIYNLRSSFGSWTAKTINRRFEYDNGGRLINEWHQIDNGADVLLMHNEYNEVGQLVDKKLHSTVAAATDAKQSLDYRYNIRGWLTSMNNAAISSDNTLNDDTNDLFGFELGYEKNVGVTATPQYNGNISAMKWSNNLGLSSIKEKSYAYGYDMMNRLKSADYGIKTAGLWSAAANNGFSESNYQYDLNGNILSLTRYDQRGTTAPMDNITYDYGIGLTQGNQLMKVSEKTGTSAGDLNKGFVDGTNSGNDYTYDANGNMLTDQNKGISTNITYNNFNLPWVISNGGNTLTYIYDGSGRKLSQISTFNASAFVNETTYAGEFQYKNNALQFIQHEEGRIVVSKEETVFTSDGGSTTGFTALTLNTLTQVTQNGNGYVKALSKGTTGSGIFPIGGTIPASPGQKFKIRVKGYRTGTHEVYLIAKTDLGNINFGNTWYGARLASAAASEQWVEETIEVPAGATQVQFGVTWNTTTSGEIIFVNDVEITQITANTAPEYQYHLKDHLGNVRLTFTTKQDIDAATATMETANANQEQSKFLYYNEAIIIDQQWFDHTNTGPTYYSTRLTGSANEKYGLAKSLSVMPGDVISTEVFVKYLDQNTSNWTTALSNFMASIANGTAPAGTVVDGGAPGSTGGPIPFPPINHSSETGVGPKAYLNYIVFDKDMATVLDMGYSRVTTAAAEYGQDGPHDRLHFDNIQIKEPGYIYIYLSNESDSPVEVYFDDFSVTHAKSPVIQMEDYYPFGLVFNEYSRENTVSQEYKYGSKEARAELGLNWLDFGARMYSPELGRWGCADPLSDKAVNLTPYRYGLNNPMRFVDPNGMYETDGHYWTVYLMLTIMGVNHARDIAYWTEYPDNVMSPGGEVIQTRYTYLPVVGDQDGTHAITGGNPEFERVSSISRAGLAYGGGYPYSLKEFGQFLHRFGDSFAHTEMNGSGKMYDPPFGHGNEADNGETKILQGHAADKIYNRPWLYMSYVFSMGANLAKMCEATPPDLFTFSYVAHSGADSPENCAVFETEIRIREKQSVFHTMGNNINAIDKYVSARNQRYGSKITAISVTALVDHFYRDKNGDMQHQKKWMTITNLFNEE